MKHLRYISAKDTTEEVCIIYGSITITITTIHNCFKIFKAGNLDSKDKEKKKKLMEYPNSSTALYYTDNK